MARYTHDLMGLRPDALQWGIAGAGLMPADRRMAESLAPQDALYTLIERDGAVKQRAKLSRFWSAPLGVDRIKPLF